MSLSRELRQSKLEFLLAILIGAYLGVATIIAIGFLEHPQAGVFILNFLIPQILHSSLLLFQSIVVICGFITISVLILYCRVASKAYRKIEDQLQQALSTNKLKDEFATMVLHYIRTPLSGVKWSLKEMLKAADIAGDHRKLLEEIFRENENCLTAIDSLVTASQVSLDHINYNLQVISIKEIFQLIQEKIDIFQTSAKNKNIQIINEIAIPSDALFKIDRDKIITVFETILENAIMYTPSNGKITVTAHEGKTTLVISITDTGIGILPEDQPKIFLQFFRTKDAKKIKPMGFGIGLYLSQSFIEHHGGKISFSSQYKKGTIFNIILPKLNTSTEETLQKI